MPSNNSNNSHKDQQQQVETPKKKHVDCSIQKINWTTHDDGDDAVASWGQPLDATARGKQAETDR